MSDMGPAERQVRSAKVRTMEFNHYGQYSILLGVAVAFVFAVNWLALGEVHVVSRGFIPLFFAGLGFLYGVRGVRAAARGLATNWTTSIVGMLLTGGFIVVETALFVGMYF